MTDTAFTIIFLLAPIPAVFLAYLIGTWYGRRARMIAWGALD